MIPDDVKAAAELLGKWCLAEAVALRLARSLGPAVVLFELVGAVCGYFLDCAGAGERKG